LPPQVATPGCHPRLPPQVATPGSDPFGGSGSTLMACQHLGLRARLLELAPRFVDVIVWRWQEATGGTAQLEGSGSFAAVAEERK